jgi:hypothetical protein
MLRRIIFFVVCIVCLITCSTRISETASNCNQSFLFLLATADNNPVFWIAEDVGGECWYSHLIQIAVEDTTDTATYTALGSYKSWNWKGLEEKLKGVICQPAIELENQNGMWSLPGLSWRIGVPPPDSAMLKLLQKEYKAGRERSWNVNYGIKGVSVPSAEGLDIEMVYYYPEGLYIDYTISKVYYFPQSRYILVFTNQPRMASGLDTMHGFLLLKIVKDSGG